MYDIKRIFKEDVAIQKFKELWYARPGETIFVDGAKCVITANKSMQENLQFVDVIIKKERTEN